MVGFGEDPGPRPDTGDSDGAGADAGGPPEDDDPPDFPAPDRSPPEDDGFEPPDRGGSPPADSGEEGNRVDDVTPSPDPGLGGAPENDNDGAQFDRPDRRGPSERQEQREVAREVGGVTVGDIQRVEDDGSVTLTDSGRVDLARDRFEAQQEQARRTADIDDPTITAGTFEQFRERQARQQFEQQRAQARQTADVDDVSRLGGVGTSDLDFEATGAGVTVSPEPQPDPSIDPEAELDAVTRGQPTDISTDTDPGDFSIAGDGPLASVGVPGTGTDIGGALGTVSRGFNRQITEPLAREAGRDRSGTIAGLSAAQQIRGPLTEDFTRSFVAGFNPGDIGALGVRVTDESIIQSEPSFAGGPVTTAADPERAEQQAEVAREVGEAGVEFAAENPARAGAIGAGAVAGGVGAGAVGRVGVRGARRGASAARNIDVPEPRIGTLADDTRAQLEFGRSRGDDDSVTIEGDDIASGNDFDPQRVTRAEVSRAPETAVGRTRSSRSFSQSFTDSRPSGSRRGGRGGDDPDRVPLADEPMVQDRTFDIATDDTPADPLDTSGGIDAIGGGVGSVAAGSSVGGQLLSGVQSATEPELELSQRVGQSIDAPIGGVGAQAGTNLDIGTDTTPLGSAETGVGLDTDAGLGLDSQQRQETSQRPLQILSGQTRIGIQQAPMIGGSAAGEDSFGQQSPRTTAPTVTSSITARPRLDPDIEFETDTEDEQLRSIGFGGATFESPTQGLGEISDDLVEMFDGGDNGP